MSITDQAAPLLPPIPPVDGEPFGLDVLCDMYALMEHAELFADDDTES